MSSDLILQTEKRTKRGSKLVKGKVQRDVRTSMDEIVACKRALDDKLHINGFGDFTHVAQLLDYTTCKDLLYHGTKGEGHRKNFAEIKRERDERAMAIEYKLRVVPPGRFKECLRSLAAYPGQILEVDLSTNDFSNAGDVKRLVDYSMKNGGVQTVNLSECRLKGPGLTALTPLLLMESLTNLDLRYNHIDKEGGEALRHALHYSLPTLKFICVGTASLPIQALRSGEQTDLNLNYRNIGAGEAMVVSAVISLAASLTRVILIGNKIIPKKLQTSILKNMGGKQKKDGGKNRFATSLSTPNLTYDNTNVDFGVDAYSNNFYGIRWLAEALCKHPNVRSVVFNSNKPRRAVPLERFRRSHSRVDVQEAKEIEANPKFEKLETTYIATFRVQHTKEQDDRRYDFVHNTVRPNKIGSQAKATRRHGHKMGSDRNNNDGSDNSDDSEGSDSDSKLGGTATYKKSAIDEPTGSTSAGSSATSTAVLPPSTVASIVSKPKHCRLSFQRWHLLLEEELLIAAMLRCQPVVLERNRGSAVEGEVEGVAGSDGHRRSSSSSSDQLLGVSLAENDVSLPGARALSDALLSNHCLVSLDLRDNTIGVEGAACLASALCEQQHLTSLNLSANGLAEDGGFIIADMLWENYSLTALGLGSNRLGLVGSVPIIAALRHNDTLTELDMSANGFDTNSPADDGALLFADLLLHSALHRLDLSGNGVSEHGWDAIGHMLLLTSEKDSANAAERRKAMLLAKGNRRALIGRAGARLSQSDCDSVGGRRALLQDACSTRLAMATTDKWRVGPADVCLHAASRGLCSADAVMLAGVVRANTSLVLINLSDNALCGLGNKTAGATEGGASDSFGNYCGRGLEALGRAVRLARQLETLILAGNQIGRYSVKPVVSFLNSLRRHPSLTHLDLSRNSLGPTGSNAYDVSAVAALAKVVAPDLIPAPKPGSGGRYSTGPLPSWEKPEDYGAPATAIPTSGDAETGVGVEVAKVVYYCGLHTLNLADNGMTANALEHLTEAMARNSSVRVLDLSQNCLALGGLKAISAMLIRNQTLTQVDVSRNGAVTSGGDQYVEFIEKELGLTVERSLQILELKAVEIEAIQQRRERKGKGRGEKKQEKGEAEDRRDTQKKTVPSYKMVDAVDARLVFHRKAEK